MYMRILDICEIAKRVKEKRKQKKGKRKNESELMLNCWM